GLLQRTIYEDNRNGEARIELALYYEEQAKRVEEGSPEAELKREELFSKAKLYFEQAQMIPDSEMLARQRHGQMLVSRGKYDEALPLLRKVHEMKPNDRFEEYLRRVERAARRHNAKLEADRKNS